ncbi:MAG TPA: DivIVA domain-containing protein [Thermodesulfobacteriota bacterium]|nr:DivIVA domain-containing protein [Thermodesulfobacteriota bacterium]
MKLTPDDIMNQNFGHKAVGFNKDEVRAFLEIVAGEFEELMNENTVLKKKLEEKDDRINLISETRGEVKEILSTLQQFSRDSLEMSRQNSATGQEFVKKGEEIVRTISSKIGTETEIRQLVETIQKFKEHINELQSNSEFVTKDDLKRFISTVHKMKEEELEKADEEAKRIVSEAHQRAKAMIREAEGEAENRKEEAALIVNEASQRAEELIREAENEKEKRMTEAAQLTKDAQERAKAMVRDAEVEMEKMNERAAQIVKDAQQQARAMVKDAEVDIDKRKEEAAQIIRDAHQQSGTIVRDAKSEEEKIRIEIASLKKQHKLFEDRIREAIGFHLKLLGSIEEDEQIKAEEIFNQIQQQIVDGEEREEHNVEAVSNVKAVSEEQPAFSPFVAPKSQS